MFSKFLKDKFIKHYKEIFDHQRSILKSEDFIPNLILNRLKANNTWGIEIF